MAHKKFTGLILLVLTFILLPGCGGAGPRLGLGGQTVTVSIVYGSEKQEWLEPLVQEYNNAQHKTEQGSTIVIEATPMGSIESMEAIIAQQIQPTVWSPASSVYLPVGAEEWRNKHASELIEGNPNDLVLSPVVIAMWQPMAEALGWPKEPIGWTDIAELAVSEEGWTTYGYPEWGQFKFGHTHPGFSNSGLVAVLAEAYAGAGKQRDLTTEDLGDPALRDFMAQVESSIIHYGTSTGFFGQRMFERGPSYLSAAVLYENLIVAQENKRLQGESAQLPVVAIYPKEGTFWANHPYAILNVPWVSEEQKTAAKDFETFLLANAQQQRAMQYGFRPADPSIPLTAPLDARRGVDPNQPQTVLEVPAAEVIRNVQTLWRQVKKPVDLVLVIDTSGSMSGEKITAARNSLAQFINLLDNRDRVQVITFSSEVNNLTPLSPLADKREDLTRRVSAIIEQGDTRLYDAALIAYNDLQTNGAPKHIRAVVILSDGEDTASTHALAEVMAAMGNAGGEGGHAIKLFTIAYGNDANTDILRQIAELTGGKQFKGDPSTINQIYAEIALFF
ncbi:MAG: VWA domain-containing protein [Anaerolineae bacterium]|nr:VWA domain-containing protein [Anaerolineae bacterium]